MSTPHGESGHLMKPVKALPDRLRLRLNEAAGALRVIVGMLRDHKKKCATTCGVEEIALAIELDSKQLDWYAKSMIFESQMKRKAKRK